MADASLKRAYMKIEDDMIVLAASASVLHLAFAELEAQEKGCTALAQSLWFTAKSIEAACDRIEATLYGEIASKTPPCAIGRKEQSQ